MIEKTLAILDSLTTRGETRNRRMETLLRPYDATETDGWYMCVPSFFNAAMDILETQRVYRGDKRLVWTQGSAFYFEQDYVLFDNPGAYRGTWKESLDSFHRCVIVLKSDKAIPGIKTEARYPGTITFKECIADPGTCSLKTVGIVEMTQDAFIRYLIQGP